jgi:hypothetical protein
VYLPHDNDSLWHLHSILSEHIETAIERKRDYQRKGERAFISEQQFVILLVHLHTILSVFWYCLLRGFVTVVEAINQ